MTTDKIMRLAEELPAPFTARPEGRRRVTSVHAIRILAGKLPRKPSAHDKHDCADVPDTGNATR